MVYLVGTMLVLGSGTFVRWMRRARAPVFMGGGILGGFSKSPAKRYETTNKPVTFSDVAGLEGVKNDLQEVVEFLKNPEKFQRLGGRVPKGILLMGPPGTGKTLLARAVAGEAGVPFFSISGSEFIQMFVGVGAPSLALRDMLKTGQGGPLPSILFIDEIDGRRPRARGRPERRRSRRTRANAQPNPPSEMDGFSQTESAIVLARHELNPDVARSQRLLRSGRFDRHINGRSAELGCEGD